MVGGALRVLRLLPPLKLVTIAEILLKVELNTKYQSINPSIIYCSFVSDQVYFNELLRKNPCRTIHSLVISTGITKFGGLIVFAPFLIIIKSPKQRLETYCFCSVSYYYFYFYYYYYYSYSFFPRSMNLSTADLRTYRTEFHETWWSYRYMFLVDPKVFRFVVKGVKAIFLGVQRGWGLL